MTDSGSPRRPAQPRASFLHQRQLGWKVKSRGGGAPPGRLPRLSPGSDRLLSTGRQDVSLDTGQGGSREPWPWMGEGRLAGKGARRRAHPSRLSTWQLQFTRPSLILSLIRACHGASGSPARASSWGQGARGPLSKSSGSQGGAHLPSSLSS